MAGFLWEEGFRSFYSEVQCVGMASFRRLENGVGEFPMSGKNSGLALRNSAKEMNGANTIEEAVRISRFLVEREREECRGSVDRAMHRASERWSIEYTAFHALRYRWRELSGVYAHVLDALREAYEAVYESERRKLEHEAEITRLAAAKSPRKDLVAPVAALADEAQALVEQAKAVGRQDPAKDLVQIR